MNVPCFHILVATSKPIIEDDILGQRVSQYRKTKVAGIEKGDQLDELTRQILRIKCVLVLLLAGVFVLVVLCFVAALGQYINMRGSLCFIYTGISAA